MSKKILVLEDDAQLREQIVKIVDQAGYSVVAFDTIAAAKGSQLDKFSLLLLDWTLPDGQSVHWLKELRSQHVDTPIIFLTAKTDLIDKIMGLELGADDYITKPFEPRELIARIHVQMRANFSEKPKNNILESGPVKINFESREIFFKGTLIVTNRKEFDLITMLVENPNKVFTRAELLDLVWGYEEMKTTRTVDTHMAQIRSKTSEEIFETIRGVGYKYKPAKVA